MLPSLARLQAPSANSVPIDAYLDRELASLITRLAQSLRGVLSFEVRWRELVLTGLHAAFMTISLNMEPDQGNHPMDWVAPASAAGVAAMCRASRQFYADHRGEGLGHCRERRGWCGNLKPLESGWASAADATQTHLNVQMCTFTHEQKVEFETLCEALAKAEEDRNLDVAQGKPHDRALVAQKRNAVLAFLNPLVRGPIAAFADAFVGSVPLGNVSREFESKDFKVSMAPYGQSWGIVNLPDLSDLNLPPRYVDHAQLNYDFPFTIHPAPDSDLLEQVTTLLTNINFYNSATDGERSQ